MEQEQHGLEEWFSKCGPYTSNIPWKFSGLSSLRELLAQNKDGPQGHPDSAIYSYI